MVRRSGGIGLRDRREKSLGVRVIGWIQDGVGRANFNNPARIHDGNPISDMSHHR
jgi:hypothetical protein